MGEHHFNFKPMLGLFSAIESIQQRKGYVANTKTCHEKHEIACILQPTVQFLPKLTLQFFRLYYFYSLSDIHRVKWIILTIFILSALYIESYGRARYSFDLQFFDDFTLLAPINLLIYLFFQVPNQPYIETQ